MTTILAAVAEGYSREMDVDEVRALDALRGASAPRSSNVTTVGSPTLRAMD
ncbi:MAG: hypothetical protein QNJ06_12285 [Kiloniellales bacterium]|nr:hypothetical protein [Kiloniellales bacterium]